MLRYKQGASLALVPSSLSLFSGGSTEKDTKGFEGLHASSIGALFWQKGVGKATD